MKCLAAINGKKSNFTHSSGFLGDQQPLKMSYFLVYAIPIWIQLIRNSEFICTTRKICVNENVLVSFSMCMYSCEMKEVKNWYVYCTSSKGC